jgi:arsenite methyltransferase
VIPPSTPIHGAIDMADITTVPGTSACCAPAAQTTCCAPSDKAACCGAKAAGEPCGCAAGQAAEPSHDIREAVRDAYAGAAGRFASEGRASCGCTTGPQDAATFGAGLYAPADVGDAAATALPASLGCGVPTAVAGLREGEVVLDLGSGAGADVLISAKRVGATGRAIGLDMTDEMLELARAHATAAGVANAEFLKGYIEDIPLPDESVDVVISNCVINLAGDKYKALAETARVLRPGGRFAVSDVIADPDMDGATRADLAAYTGCIAGALTENEFHVVLRAVGLREVEVTPTHRVHEHAASAVIRARKPASA